MIGSECLTKDASISQKCQQNVSRIAQRHEYRLSSAGKKSESFTSLLQTVLAHCKAKTYGARGGGGALCLPQVKIQLQISYTVKNICFTKSKIA